MTAAFRKVLVIDDLEVVHNVFQLFLQERRYKIIKAMNGGEGLEILSREKEVDIIFLDIKMPVMDGVEFMERFICDNRNKDVPIVVITAPGFKDKVAKCREMGAVECLHKPFNAAQLEAMIKQVLDGGGEESAASRPEGLD